MTNRQILVKVRKIARANGWKPDKELTTTLPLSIHIPVKEYYAHEFYRIYIFNHGLARALWGEVPLSDSERLNVPAWKYHLQQMVIADDPIKYLGKHI